MQISYLWLEHHINNEKEKFEPLGVYVYNLPQQDISRFLDVQALSNRDDIPCWEKK